MKNTLGGLLCELSVAQESISETEDMKIDTSRANEQREDMNRGIKTQMTKHHETMGV